MRADMVHVRGIESDRRMYAVVAKVIEQIRDSVKKKEAGKS